MFSEVGLYSGIAATDWSWAPLWMDFDNDGLKDLFIANGIPKRLNDMDYINFIYNSEIQEKLKNNDIKNKDMALMDKFPEIKIPNKFYKNKADLQFEDVEAKIDNDQPTYSNGAVYGDFDNDGDLDVVVNNINDPVLLYENRTENESKKDFVDIKLKGSEKNINAIGTKVVLCKRDKIETYEKNPARGFMSSMETPIHIGLGISKIDSAFLIWPDNSFQKIVLDSLFPHLFFTYTKGLPLYNYNNITNFKKNISTPIVNITKEVTLDYLHKENAFNEFDREPLLPHMLSTEGPALAVADINNDGLDDIFIGASKTFHNAIFLQQPNGKFIRTIQPEMFLDSMYEDVSATWADVNNDGNIDLIIGTGGNEYYGADEHLLPRIYLNDGKVNFKKIKNTFPSITATTSCIIANDFNNDGFVDLFLGGRTVPWNYGEIPHSYLLQNDGTGKFTDVTEKYAPELSKIGMVTNAIWLDIDKNNNKDLIVTCEWGGITAFINTNGKFVKKELTDKKGWWNFLLPVDIDSDGDMDLIAGNLGLNSRLQATTEQPVRLYFNDFDDNEKKEQILTYYVKNKEITFASKDELQKQMPMIKKKFIYAADFANAQFKDLFPAEKIKNATVYSADYFANAVLINNGNLTFTTKALPWEAQLTSYKDAAIANVNNNNLPDIILAGNYYSNNIHAGRYDADYGTVLLNKGMGNFSCENLNGLILKGEVRSIKPIKIGNNAAHIVAKNNDSVLVIKFANYIK
jgi:enediyne biosynthesis protein E4